MKYLNLILLSFLCLSCAVTKKKESKSKNQLSYFLFKDLSGEYIVKREVINRSNQLAIRQSLYAPENQKTPLEKSVTVSKFGAVKNGKSLSQASRPFASQYSIWFEQKEFFTQFQLNVKKRGFDIYMKSPEKKWNGKQFVSVPKGHRFCWFSQIPECVKKLIKLDQRNREKTSFYIVWDNFPYYSEQLQNLSGKPLVKASIYYEGKFEKSYRYAVSFSQQIIFYHFNSDFEFEKMFWVAQGIVMVRNDSKGIE